MTVRDFINSYYHFDGKEINVVIANSCVALVKFNLKDYQSGTSSVCVDSYDKLVDKYMDYTINKFWITNVHKTSEASGFDIIISIDA